MGSSMIRFAGTAYINDRELNRDEKEAIQKNGGVITKEMAEAIMKRTLGEFFTVETVYIHDARYEE